MHNILEQYVIIIETLATFVIMRKLSHNNIAKE